MKSCVFGMLLLLFLFTFVPGTTKFQNEEIIENFVGKKPVEDEVEEGGGER